MGRTFRLTLGQLFLTTSVVLGVMTLGLLWGVQEFARRSIVSRSEALRASAATRVEREVLLSLGEAASLVDKMEKGLRANAIGYNDPNAILGPLYAELLSRPHVSDITFTQATLRGHGADGSAMFYPAPRWQASVFRDPGAISGIGTRVVQVGEGGTFVEATVHRTPLQGFSDGTQTLSAGSDPTEHPTFSTPVDKDFFGQSLWSDLHYSEGSDQLPAAARPVVMSVQKAVVGRTGQFAGVVRVGLEANVLRAIGKMRVNEEDPSDPHRVFVSDQKGRLLTPLSDGDTIGVFGDDLRIAARQTPPAIERALHSPLLERAKPGQPTLSEVFTLGGRRYLLSVRAIRESQDWLVGIVVPEDYYTSDIKTLRDRNLLIFGIAAGCALGMSILVLRSVRSGLRILTQTTVRMRDFDFSAEPSRPTHLQDVWDVSESLERAKTALRAMGRYVPIDLVRDLYHSNVEPQLGGTLSTVTLMFTDIEGFTTLSETMSPNDLAQTLGAYFQVMTEAIRSTHGTVDKFIGDAVMAMWNAPEQLEKHAAAACQAALLCQQATHALYNSPAWGGKPPLVTRFGVHSDRVLVGHFGAPARMSFTAMGDGVNLASRLEGLCKQYHVQAIVSGTVRYLAGNTFTFRRLDRVAVKGKSQAVEIFELCGQPNEAAIKAYEAALDLYWKRRFSEAAELLNGVKAHDGPSAMLAQRCVDLQAQPPPADWDGVWVAHEK